MSIKNRLAKLEAKSPPNEYSLTDSERKAGLAKLLDEVRSYQGRESEMPPDLRWRAEKLAVLLGQRRAENASITKEEQGHA